MLHHPDTFTSIFAKALCPHQHIDNDRLHHSNCQLLPPSTTLYLTWSLFLHVLYFRLTRCLPRITPRQTQIVNSLDPQDLPSVPQVLLILLLLNPLPSKSDLTKSCRELIPVIISNQDDSNQFFNTIREELSTVISTVSPSLKTLTDSMTTPDEKCRKKHRPGEGLDPDT